MRLTRYEQETIILMNAGDKEATVYTADCTVMRRLDALVKAYPESYRIVSEDEMSKTYILPKTYVSYRKPRNLSETQREQARHVYISECNIKLPRPRFRIHLKPLFFQYFLTISDTNYGIIWYHKESTFIRKCTIFRSRSNRKGIAVWQKLEMLRSETHTRDIPVMFLTSNNDRESIINVMSLNPVNYLLKSLPRSEIYGKIKAFFEQ